MDDELTRITGLIDRERKQELSWWANLPESKCIEIMQDAMAVFFQLKQSNPGLSGKFMRYCALILAGRRNGWDTVRGRGYRVAAEPQFKDFDKLREAKVAGLISRGRRPILRKKVLAYWGEVVAMKAQGYGFRPIATYLTNTRKIKVSSVYLGKLWREVNVA